MYYTGLDPRTMKPVYVPTNPHEKAMQRALIQYRNPKNYYLVREALEQAGRQDLIGFEKNCLIRPYPPGQQSAYLRGKKPPEGGRNPAKGKPAPKGRPASGGRSASSKGVKPGKRPAGWAKPKPKPNARKKK